MKTTYYSQEKNLEIIAELTKNVHSIMQSVILPKIDASAMKIIQSATTSINAENVAISNFISNYNLIRFIAAVAINETCTFNEECETFVDETECRNNICTCLFEKQPITHSDGRLECVGWCF